MKLNYKFGKIIKKIMLFIKSEKLLFCVAFLVCLANALFMFDNAIWGDEGFSIMLARRNLAGILTGTAADVHPPLYYIILKIIISVLGESVFVLHLTSFLAFVGVCILIITFVYKNFGIVAAYLALFFAGWTEVGVIYSVEIRMYSMALLFVTLTFCIAYKVIANTDATMKEWAVMSFFALMAGYTHYFALIAVAFMILGVFILCLIKRQSGIWKKIGLTTGICVVGYLPWLFAMLTTVERTVGDFWLTAIPTFSECMDMFLGAMGYSHKLLYIMIALFAIYVLVNVYDAIKNSVSVKTKLAYFLEKETKIQLAFLAIWTFVGTSFLGIVVSKYMQPVLLTRYLFPMVILGAISMGVMIEYFGEKEHLETIVFLVAMVMVIGVAQSGVEAYENRYDVFLERKEGTNKTLEIIDEFIKEDYVVVSDLEQLNWTVLEYYYPEHFVDYTKLGENPVEIEKAVMLVSWEMSEQEIQELEKEKYEINFLRDGRLDNSLFYLYSLESK